MESDNVVLTGRIRNGEENGRVEEISRVLSDGDAALKLGVTCPEGWQVRNLPNGSVAAVAPVRTGAFTPNVVMSLTAMDAEQGIEITIAASQASRDALPDASVLGEGPFEVGGRSWFITEYAFADPRAGTLVQSVRLADAGNGAAVRLTATCGDAHAKTDLSALREVMNSVTW